MSRHLKQRAPQGLATRLSANQRAELIEWLKVPTNTLARVAQMVRERFAIATSSTAISSFYKKQFAEIVGRASVAAPVPAAGVVVTIMAVCPGEMRLSVHPMQGAEIDAVDGADAELRASGVEVLAQTQPDGTIRLGVWPVATPAT